VAVTSRPLSRELRPPREFSHSLGGADSLGSPFFDKVSERVQRINQSELHDHGDGLASKASFNQMNAPRELTSKESYVISND
jgi:hypothetical protein